MPPAIQSIQFICKGYKKRSYNSAAIGRKIKIVLPFFEYEKTSSQNWSMDIHFLARNICDIIF